MKNLAVNKDATNSKTKPVSPKPTSNTVNTNAKKSGTGATVTNPQNAKNLKNAKGQIIVEEEVKPPPPKIKNIERFIYVTTYNDIETMKTLKELFEAINREALALKSVKEIYTRTLTPEEQEDNTLDYISGFQILDNNLRITILEGITGKAMKIVKERLPKLGINNSSKKVFADSRVIYDTRMYSKFNLCLKFIKLRDPLNKILVTYDIYQKATKYKEIYEGFMNLGFILQAQTLQEISDAKLFPPAESMFLLERKYADILNDEDLTGVHTAVKTKKRRVKAESLDKGSSLTSTTHNNNTTEFGSSVVLSGSVGTNINTQSDHTKINIIDGNISKIGVHTNSHSNSHNTLKSKSVNKTGNYNKSDEILLKSTKPKLDSHNYEFFKYKESQLFKQVNTHQNNLERIKQISSKAKKIDYFCRRKNELQIKDSLKNSVENSLTYSNEIELNTNVSIENENKNKKSNEVVNLPNYGNVYMYSNQRKNYYADYFDQMREKFEKDNNNFYTYSKDYLTLSFPMIKNSNAQYDEYIENKNVLYSIKI